MSIYLKRYRVYACADVGETRWRLRGGGERVLERGCGAGTLKILRSKRKDGKKIKNKTNFRRRYRASSSVTSRHSRRRRRRTTIIIHGNYRVADARAPRRPQRARTADRPADTVRKAGRRAGRRARSRVCESGMRAPSRCQSGSTNVNTVPRSPQTPLAPGRPC